MTLALDLLNDTGLQMSSVDPQGEEATRCSHSTHTHSAWLATGFNQIKMQGTEDEKKNTNRRPVSKIIATEKKNTLELQDSNVKLIQMISSIKSIYLCDRETPKSIWRGGGSLQ